MKDTDERKCGYGDCAKNQKQGQSIIVLLFALLFGFFSSFKFFFALFFYNYAYRFRAPFLFLCLSLIVRHKVFSTVTTVISMENII